MTQPVSNCSTGSGSVHTPLPWRASNCGYLMGSDGVGPFGKREVQVGTIGAFSDEELLPFNQERWQADLEFIVQAVNSHDALVKALDAIRRLECGPLRLARDIATDALAQASTIPAGESE